MKLSIGVMLGLVLGVAGTKAQEAALPVSAVPGLASIAPVAPGLDPAKKATEAFDAYRSGRISEAREQAWSLAETGDADALFLLGLITEASDGRGSKGASRQQSMDLFYRKSEEGGNREAGLRRAMVSLAAARENERVGAKREFEEIATGADAASCRLLGEAWLSGIMDGSRNSGKATEYWKKAADLGDVDILVPLGSLLLADNEKEGIAWLEKAASRNRLDAYLAMGTHFENTRKDADSARLHYRAGAEKGHAGCMSALSILLSKGGESEEGAKWLKAAADAGDPMACSNLGKKLFDGSGDARKDGYRYLLRAAKNGVWQAQSEVGVILLEGKLGEKDPVAAMAWLTKAMNSGDPETLYQLAMLHEKGLAGPINYSNVGILLSLASRGGHADASWRVARMAYEGYRMKNNTDGWAYAAMGAKQGSSKAKALLAEIDKNISASEKREAEEKYQQLIEGSEKAATGN